MPQPEVLPGFDPNAPEMMTSSRPQFMIEPSRGPSGYPQVVGAAGNQSMGPGNVPYQSELIRSLRAANTAPVSNNPGVTMLPNQQNSGLTLDFNKPVPTGLSNKIQKLALKPVTPTPEVVTPPAGGGGGDGGGGGSGGGYTGGGGGSIVIGPNNPVVDDDKDTDGLDNLIDDLIRDDTVGDDTVVEDKDTDGLDELINDLIKDDTVVDDTLDDGKDTDGLDQLIGDLTKGDDTVGDDKDTDGLDNLINDLTKNDSVGNDGAGDDTVPDYSDDLWGDDADADAIAQLYRDILGREADQAGLEWWDQTGLGVDQIADYFRGSDEYASLGDQADIPDYSDNLFDDAVDTSTGIDLGQADDLGGMFEMYDPLDNSSPIVFDTKGEDYSTNFGSDWLMDALFGDISGGGGGGRGGPMILFAQE
jgi:hypothetical protein